MRLSIITINYNSSGHTIKLLESLSNQTDKDFDVIVVDNNSDDIDKLTDYKTSETNPDASVGTSIIYIKNERNLGYSGGNNIGIKKALENGSDWVLLLNNDTWVESSFMESLRANLEGTGSLPARKQGIVGLALNEGDRVAYAGQVQWLKPTLKHVYDKASLNNRHVYAIGGAMLIHKSVFDKIGFLDENYFLYFEDADFCQRARKAGIPISFISEIKIHHSVSVSTKKLGSPLLLRYHYRNALYFNLKNGPLYLRFVLWMWRLEIMIKQLVKIILGINKEESIAILKGVFDYYKRNYGKIH